MKKICFIIGLVVAGIVFNGCEVEEEPTIVKGIDEGLNLKIPISENYDDYVNFMEPYERIILNGYEIILDDVIKGTGTTTFNYIVRGTGSTAQLDSFYIVIPHCAGRLLSWSPTQSSKLEDGKLKWNSSISKDGEQMFSITFEGDLDLGITEVIVVRGGIEYSDKILGPCAGVYSLTGNIFIDANVNQIKDASESGIGGYSITLSQDIDGDGSADFSDEALTLSDGAYSFEVLEGVYTVSVGADLLNDQNYTATTATEFKVEVTGNKSHINFGYKVEAAKIIKDFNDGTILLNTEDHKYWIQQIRNAGKNNSDYSQDDIDYLLGQVETTLLPEPFQFGNNKPQEALNILSRPIRSDLDLYLQQLLTAELNVVSGRGALNSDKSLNSDFNKALLIYAEAVACQAMGSCPIEGLGVMAEATAVKSTSLSTDIDLVTTFNNGSGGL